MRPGTGDPVPDGEVGEVVVTDFNPAYPLVRLGTGDLSAVLPGALALRPHQPRIAGWMGRADQRTKVKGMFVDPRQLAELRSPAPGIARLRLVVGRDGDRDAMTLNVEPAAGAALDAVGHRLRRCARSTGLGGTVADRRGGQPAQ